MEKKKEMSAHGSCGKLRKFIAAIIVNLSTLSYGISAGWSSPIIPQLRSSNPPVGQIPLTDEQISWISGLLPAGALLIVPFSGTLTEHFGRKGFGCLAGIPLIITWLLIAFGTDHVYFIYAARLVGGIGGSMSFFIAPLYVSEIASEDIRGALGSLLLFSLKIGIMFAYVAGIYTSYRIFAGLALIFPCIFLMAFFFLPETPVFLARRNQMIQAEKSLMFFRANNHELVQQELTRLKSQVNTSNNLAKKKINISRLLRDRATRRGMIIAFALIAGQQFSGIVAMVYYAETIFKRAGSSLSAETSSIIIAAIQVLSSYLSILLVERAGRRSLCLISCAGMAICHVIIGIFFYLHEYGYNVTGYEWLPLVAFASFVISFCLGMGPVPFVVTSEVFANDVASFASTACYVFMFASTFFAVKMFGTVMSLLGGGCFFVLAGFCLACFGFYFFMLPETKGRAREDIVRELAGIVDCNGKSIDDGECDDEGQELVTIKPV